MIIPPAETLIYTVDSDNTFSSFTPGSNPSFTDIGTLDCNDPDGGTPFSMAVARNGIAWVIFSSGHLYNVNLSDAGCEASAYQEQESIPYFGMGFVSNGPNSTQDTLFVAGTVGGLTNDGNAELGVIDTTSLELSIVDTVGGSPELTGTGSGQLWGFFPQFGSPSEGVDATIEQIDPTSGAVLQTLTVPELDGMATAWAFAYYGGDFWVFLATGGATNVWHVDGTTGAADLALSMPFKPNGSARTIVGAGVSTFVPTGPGATPN